MQGPIIGTSWTKEHTPHIILGTVNIFYYAALYFALLEFYALCLCVCLLFFALIASLLRRESKQAKKKSDTQAQSIKFKQGKIKCCKEKNITAPPNAWRNIPFFD